MRLFDTYTRGLFELPPPPGPIRMYFCGPTVYQRIHIGNARPFVLSMWLKRWLERSGYEVTLVENITDVNDKIYDAAPGKSAELAAQASAWYVEDTSDLCQSQRHMLVVSELLWPCCCVRDRGYRLGFRGSLCARELLPDCL